MLNRSTEKYPFKDLQIERGSDEYEIKKISADNLDGITAQLGFEMKNGYTQHDTDWPEKTAPERREQMENGGLVLHVVRKNGEIIASTEIILNSGTKGKVLGDDEAWASGTLIQGELQGRGIGKLCADTQERVAKEAGKKAIRTSIWNDNYSSMRLRMRNGYRLVGEGSYKNIDPKKPDAMYRKVLTEEPPITKHTTQEIQQHLNTERQAGHLPVATAMDADSPDQVLIDPSNAPLMNQALEQGYVGVYLLIPKDIPNDAEIDKNFVVFIKVEKLPEKQ